MAAPDPARTPHAPPPRVTFLSPDAPFPAGDNFEVVGRVRSSARTLARLASPPTDPWDVRVGLGPNAEPVPAARLVPHSELHFALPRDSETFAKLRRYGLKPTRDVLYHAATADVDVREGGAE